jgi:hypothetical protein
MIASLCSRLPEPVRSRLRRLCMEPQAGVVSLPPRSNSRRRPGTTATVASASRRQARRRRSRAGWMTCCWTTHPGGCSHGRRGSTSLRGLPHIPTRLIRCAVLKQAPGRGNTERASVTSGVLTCNGCACVMSGPCPIIRARRTRRCVAALRTRKRESAFASYISLPPGDRSSGSRRPVIRDYDREILPGAVWRVV